MNRFVDVTFNSLDTTINLQTWVVLLDFLGIGGPAPKSRASPEEKALWRLKKKAASKAASSRTDAETLSATAGKILKKKLLSQRTRGRFHIAAYKI